MPTNSTSEGKTQNSTVFVTKVSKYKIHVTREEAGFVSVINNNFLIATDETLPLGVDLHMRFDRHAEKRVRTEYALPFSKGRIGTRALTGNVNKASYSLPNCSKHIPILISPNYQSLCKQAKISLRPQYPGVVFNSRPSC